MLRHFDVNSIKLIHLKRLFHKFKNVRYSGYEGKIKKPVTLTCSTRACEGWLHALLHQSWINICVKLQHFVHTVLHIHRHDTRPFLSAVRSQSDVGSESGPSAMLLLLSPRDAAANRKPRCHQPRPPHPSPNLPIIQNKSYDISLLTGSGFQQIVFFRPKNCSFFSCETVGKYDNIYVICLARTWMRNIRYFQFRQHDEI